MIIHIELNEDHLKLIPFIMVADKDDDFLSINKSVFLTLQSHLLDDVSLVLGLRDHVIPGTLDDAEGIALPDEIEKRCLDAYNYIKDNLFYILQLALQFSTKGGLTVGKYKAKDTDLIFEREV